MSVALCPCVESFGEPAVKFICYAIFRRNFNSGKCLVRIRCANDCCWYTLSWGSEAEEDRTDTLESSLPGLWGTAVELLVTTTTTTKVFKKPLTKEVNISRRQFMVKSKDDRGKIKVFQTVPFTAVIEMLTCCIDLSGNNYFIKYSRNAPFSDIFWHCSWVLLLEPELES